MHRGHHAVVVALRIFDGLTRRHGPQEVVATRSRALDEDLPRTLQIGHPRRLRKSYSIKYFCLLSRVFPKPNSKSGQQYQFDQEARTSSDNQSSLGSFGETRSGNVDCRMSGMPHSTVQQHDTNRNKKKNGQKVDSAGIAQGRVLSPLLFNILVDGLARAVHVACPGVSLMGTWDSRFAGKLHADDLVVVADSFRQVWMQCQHGDSDTGSRSELGHPNPPP